MILCYEILVQVVDTVSSSMLHYLSQNALNVCDNMISYISYKRAFLSFNNSVHLLIIKFQSQLLVKVEEVSRSSQVNLNLNEDPNYTID